MSLHTERRNQLRPVRSLRYLLPIAMVAALNGLYLIFLPPQSSHLTNSANLDRDTMTAPDATAPDALGDTVPIAQAEARHMVNIMARSQQAYYRRYGEFAVALSDLGLEQDPDAPLYLYRTFTYHDRQGLVMVAAVPRHEGFKTYLGFINVIHVEGGGKILTEAILCQSREAKPMLRRLPYKAPNDGIVPCPIGFVSAPMI